MTLWNFLAEKLRAVQEVKTLYHCDHQHDRLVYIIQSNGAIQYKRQCQDCYQDTTLFLSHKKLSRADKASAVPRDDERKTAHFQSYLNERRRLQQEAFWKLYAEYLASPEWAARRHAVLDRDGDRCQLKHRGCTRKATQVHHLTYANVGNEPLEDLVSICVHCHEIVTAESRR